MDEQQAKKPNPERIPGIVGPLDIDSVLRSSIVPRLYANSFSVGHSLLESTILVQHGKAPIAAISLSFPALKSLHFAIGEALQLIEKGLGEPIPTIQELNVKWTKNNQ